jgi:hypothetical protein
MVLELQQDGAQVLTGSMTKLLLGSWLNSKRNPTDLKKYTFSKDDIFMVDGVFNEGYNVKNAKLTGPSKTVQT